MAAPSYMLTDNDPTLARLIKQGAIFLRTVGSTPPSSDAWTPSDETPIGYYSDDGFTLSPQPGDETEHTGHNGDVILAEQDDGFWTASFSPLQAQTDVIEAYFDVTVDGDGSVTVTKASTSKRYDLILAGADQSDRVIVTHIPNAQINAREDLVFNRTSLLLYGLTFRTFLGPEGARYHFKSWGLVPDDEGDGEGDGESESE